MSSSLDAERQISFNLNDIVQQVAQNKQEGLSELYRLLHTQVRPYVGRRLVWSEGVDDVLHDVFLTAAACLRHGVLKDPDKLRSFVVGIARHLTSQEIRRMALRRVVEVKATRVSVSTAYTPEQLLQAAETRKLGQLALSRLPPDQREILERFYLREQTVAQICREMGLTATQFRLMKSRAKVHFGTLGRLALTSRPS